MSRLCIKKRCGSIYFYQIDFSRFRVIVDEKIICETTNAREAAMCFSQEIERKTFDSLMAELEAQGFDRYTGEKKRG